MLLAPSCSSSARAFQIAESNEQSWCGAATATQSPTEPLAWAGRCHLSGGRGMGLPPLLGEGKLSPSLFSQAFLETSHVFWRLLFFLLYRKGIRWPKTAPDSFNSTSGLSLLFPSSLASCTSQHNSSETFDILSGFQTQFPITEHKKMPSLKVRLSSWMLQFPCYSRDVLSVDTRILQRVFSHPSESWRNIRLPSSPPHPPPKKDAKSQSLSLSAWLYFSNVWQPLILTPDTPALKSHPSPQVLWPKFAWVS